MGLFGYMSIDYRALNEWTLKGSFPLHRVDYLLDKLRDAKCITHLDLRSVSNQVRMPDDGPPDDSIVTTTCKGLTPNETSCLLEMLAMGFGLYNALATFSWRVNHVLEPLINNFVIVYLDDMCIYSETLEHHILYFRLVLHH